MALMTNGYRLGFSPFRYRGGALVSIYTPARTPQAQGGPGALRSTQLNFGTLSAIPQGNRHPSAWLMPQKAGGMASHNRCDITLTASGEGALGRNMQAAATISIDASAIGGLIAGGVGNATISINASGDIVATIGAPGSATISLIGSADIGALGWLEGTSEISIDGSLIAYAIGHMSGTTENLAEMTPGTVATAVWSAVAAGFNEAGTMGNKLNTASSGGVDLNALAAAVHQYAVEGGYTFEQVTRIIAAALAGTSEKAGSTITFKGLDGTTDRIVGSFDAENNRTGAILDGS